MQIYKIFNILKRVFGADFRKLILLACLLTLHIYISAQKRISVDLKNATIEQAFKTISKESGYTFAYNKSRYSSDKLINFSANNSPLDEVMAKILKGTGYSFSISDNRIFLIEAKEEKKPDIAAPTLQVSVSYIGISAYVMMNSVIIPLEDVINGTIGVTNITSSTKTGSANITAYFKQGSDRDKAAANVQNLANQISSLLPGVTQVEVTEKKQQGNIILMISLLPDDQTDIENATFKIVNQEFRKLDSTEVRRSLLTTAVPKPTLSSLSLLTFSRQERLSLKKTTLAIKTNLLYDLTSTFNLGAEVRLSDRFTFDLSVNYNPWTFNDNKKISHLMFQPELRYWLCESFKGHFFGFHTQYARFNVGGVGFTDYMKDHRFQGDMYGAGFSYGYQWYLSPRWSMEATVGFGYNYLDYKRYECKNCGTYIDSDKKNYFGPTKAGISLIYMIK